MGVVKSRFSRVEYDSVGDVAGTAGVYHNTSLGIDVLHCGDDDICCIDVPHGVRHSGLEYLVVRIVVVQIFV